MTRRHADVAALKPFKDANKFAQNQAGNRLYVVYSYGIHFPLLVHDRKDGTWYTNMDKYSPTTSRHRSECTPYGVRAEPVTTGVLMRIIHDALADMTDTPITG